MNGWDKNEYVQAPIPSRSQAGWVGWKPGRYRSVLEDRSYSLANKGYSWKDIGNILKAGIQGGIAEGTPIHGMFIQPVKDLKRLPHTFRKLKRGNPQYSTPPSKQSMDSQVKQAKIKEQNMTYQGICAALRGGQMKKEASVKKLATVLSMKKRADLPTGYMTKLLRDNAGRAQQGDNQGPRALGSIGRGALGALIASKGTQQNPGEQALDRLKTSAPGAGTAEALPNEMPKWYYQALGQQVKNNTPSAAFDAAQTGFFNFWPNRVAMDASTIGNKVKNAWNGMKSGWSKY